MNINCDICGEELKEPGALLFTPPKGLENKCVKVHICLKCWRKPLFEKIKDILVERFGTRLALK